MNLVLNKGCFYHFLHVAWSDVSSPLTMFPDSLLSVFLEQFVSKQVENELLSVADSVSPCTL